MRNGWIFLVVTALMLVPARGLAKDRPDLPDTDGWLEARTAHFRLYSNASERVTRKTSAATPPSTTSPDSRLASRRAPRAEREPATLPGQPGESSE